MSTRIGKDVRCALTSQKPIDLQLMQRQEIVSSEELRSSPPKFNVPQSEVLNCARTFLKCLWAGEAVGFVDWLICKYELFLTSQYIISVD